jgi:hypothetical protein
VLEVILYFYKLVVQVVVVQAAAVTAQLARRVFWLQIHLRWVVLAVQEHIQEVRVRVLE